MREGHASRTAEQNALFRALESSRPPAERRIDDGLAQAFLTWPLSQGYRLAVALGARALVCRFIDRRWPGVRSSVVARTRLIDEMIAAALAEGVEQFVVLGAGFDSRAYRLPALRFIPVFEVDHPDTQTSKRRVLERMSSVPSRHVCFVACDFIRTDLESAMRAAGYDRSRPNLLLWEGVTNYLTEDAVDATLRWCSTAGPGSLLLFTYVHRDILTRPDRFVGTQRLFASLDKAGERFTWGIEPERLPEFLAERGLALRSDVGAAEYRARCYGDAARGMRGHEFYRVALASVPEPPEVPG